jgi:vitamin B12 transporter
MKERTQSHVSYDDTTYDYALRVPEHTVNITLGVRPVKALYISLTSHYESKRYDIGGYDAPDVVLKPFAILNGYAEYKVVSCLKVFVEARNIFDKKFVTVYGFNSIPTMFTAGATIEL